MIPSSEGLPLRFSIATFRPGSTTFVLSRPAPNPCAYRTGIADMAEPTTSQEAWNELLLRGSSPRRRRPNVIDEPLGPGFDTVTLRRRNSKNGLLKTPARVLRICCAPWRVPMSERRLSGWTCDGISAVTWSGCSRKRGRSPKTRARCSLSVCGQGGSARQLNRGIHPHGTYNRVLVK